MEQRKGEMVLELELCSSYFSMGSVLLLKLNEVIY